MNKLCNSKQHWTSNEQVIMCEISGENSKRWLRKWQATLGDNLFCRTQYMVYSKNEANGQKLDYRKYSTPF